MKGILKYFFVLGVIGLLFIQSNLGLNGLNFAQVGVNNEYEPSSDKFTVTKDSDGKYIDSGYRVSDTSGEVLIRRGDEPNAWENAWSGDTIYEGDVIFTAKDVECTIIISGQVTLHMQAQTEIFMDINENQNNLKVVYGKVLVDLEENYNQAPISFDLTKAKVITENGILICENKVLTSRILMLSGTANVMDLNKEVTIINSSEEIEYQETGMKEVKTFSVDSELLEWSSEIRNKVDADLLNRQSQLTNTPIQETTKFENAENTNYDMTSIFKLFAVLIIVVGVIYIILWRRKNDSK